MDVEGPAGATAADLAAGLFAAGLLEAPEGLSVDGTAVAADAPLGRRPLVNGAVLVAAGAWRGEEPQRPSHLELHVASGPDAGRVLALRPGTASVGRGADATFEIADARLSRRHFAVTLDSGGLRVSDLGSTNGTRVDGVPVRTEGADCAPGNRILAGASTFVVRTPSHRPITSREDDRGTLAVTRGPRSTAPAPAATFRRHPAPVPAERGPLPWLAMLVPLLLCAPLAWFTRQATYLLLGLASPLTMALSHLAERRARRGRDSRHVLEWKLADERTSRLIAQALTADLQHRLSCTPDPAQLLETARVPGHRLWERGPDDADQLDLAVGTGGQPSAVVVVTDDGESRPTLADAPVTVSLSDVGHLGVSGPPPGVAGVLRLLVARLVVQCSPQSLQIVVLGRDTWRWAAWLPHHLTWSSSELVDEVHRRVEAGPARSKSPSWPRLVVVVDDGLGSAPDPCLATVLDHGPAVGVHVVAGAARPQDLPSACGAVLSLDDREPAVLSRRDGRRVELTADAVAEDWAEDVARALSPLRDVTPRPGSLPTQVRLADVCDVDPSSPADVVSAWDRSRRSTTVTLGAGTSGPVRVDLVRDGPHALVAGTTGAGKSELLQTLVCSLALGNRPDELAFVLVDYKGGAAFRDLAELPHVVGLVTDLDPHLAERALASLQAELTRRERLLADAGASSFSEYLARRDAGGVGEPLARLVLVVDEFRLLADELPTFLDGLVRLASIGRSLGVHLVLATQRPAGVVTADIKANVNLRICLRVRDRTESDDVVDAPDAASLPVDVPGRAVLRVGSDPVVPLQVALAAAAAQTAEPRSVVVRPVGSAAARAPRPRPRPTAGVSMLVRAIAAAAAACGAHPTRSPWLPALPDVVRPAQLRGLAVGDAASGGEPVSAAAVTYGVVDRPDVGARSPLVWDAARSSHLAVSGMARTGRSSACLALALAAAERHDPEQLHVHVIETTERLGPALARLPHLGTAVSTAHPRLVTTLVQRLAREQPRSPHTLLIVDGWESLCEALDALDHGRTTDELLALLRDGEGWGLRAVVTGGRGVLGARVSAALPERLLLRTADPTDLLLAGASTTTSLSHQPPGRALHLPAGHEVQLVWAGDDAEVADRVEALRAQHAGRRPAASTPLQVRPLPRRAVLGRPRPEPLRGRAVEVGVGGDTADTLDLDLACAPAVAVVGPPGSGRSSVLASWAHQLHDRGVGVLVVADDGSPLAAGPWPVAAPETLVAQAAWSADVQCLLIDDADLLPEVVARHLTTWTSERERSVVVTSTTDALAGSFTGLAAAVRRYRTGVLLAPERPLDGDAFGVVAERPDVRTPGRGLLVVRGQSTAVQVALPPGETRAEQWGTAS